MAVVFENEGSPLGPDDVDGMAYLLDPEEDIGPSWDPTVDPIPSYLNLDAPSESDPA